MSEEKLRILDLFKEGKISSAETLELLSALDETAGVNEALKTDTTATKKANGSGPERSEGNRLDSSGYSNCRHLEVTLIGGGDITVDGWDGNEVIIDKPKSTRVFQKHKRTDDRYKIFCLGSVDYEVKVPYNWDLTIYTAGGDIRIGDVSGQINGKTLGGDIRLSHINGGLNLTTAGGDIKLDDSDADGHVHTMGGDIVFHNVTGNVEGTTLGGEMIRK
ncbi:MAG TPA: hypothetical protein DDW65_09185 [Firmicutes bacterium]|jgi:DUF4097 and DUF4098 domain-containing protein YvlB|nr:hypothetical protein [Bacillota bacterium]